MRKAIPKEETYNFYGDDARNIDVTTLADRATFIMVSSKGVLRDGFCIDGRLAYTKKHIPLKAGPIKRNHTQMIKEG